MTEVRGFVSHAFDESVYAGGRKAFRASIEELVAIACADFAADSITVEHKLFFEATAYGAPLMPGVRSQVRGCDFLIADISQADPKLPVNPNVMYEIGYAMALDKRIIVIRRNAEPPPPSDIGDLLAGTYHSLDEIPVTFGKRMIDVVADTLARADCDAARNGPLIWKTWFPADTRSINIVCTREPEPTRFSDGRDPNYVHVDNFEDRDALLELSSFFARSYPQATVVSHLADELPHGTRSCDLVVLGGPGCEPGEGNAVTRDLMTALGSGVRYPTSGDGLEWHGEPLRATLYEDDDDTRGVLADWGSILAAPNPYNSTARVVLLHGTTTYGTLAAALALIDTAASIRNHLVLSAAGVTDRISGANDFEALVRCTVDSAHRIIPPRLMAGDISRFQS